MKNRIETEDDRSVQVAVVHGRQDMRDEEAFNGGQSYERKRMPHGQACYKCGRQNHFARKCRLVDSTHMVDGHRNEEDEEDVLQIVVQKMGRKLMAKMQLEWNGRNVELDCQVDSAASCKVLTYNDYCLIGEAGNEEQQESTDHV